MNVNKTDRTKPKEALTATYGPVERGKSFGPSWATHWFKGTPAPSFSSFPFFDSSFLSFASAFHYLSPSFSFGPISYRLSSQ